MMKFTFVCLLISDAHLLTEMYSRPCFRLKQLGIEVKFIFTFVRSVNSIHLSVLQKNIFESVALNT